MTVLIVENEPSNRQLLEDIIAMLYPDDTVRSAENGRLAVEIIDREPVDIVLADIDMPEMDGYGLYDAIRKERKLEMPIICITAFAIKGDEEKLLRYGFDYYIPKPIMLDHLESVLDRFISR